MRRWPFGSFLVILLSIDFLMHVDLARAHTVCEDFQLKLQSFRSIAQSPLSQDFGPGYRRTFNPAIIKRIAAIRAQYKGATIFWPALSVIDKELFRLYRATKLEALCKPVNATTKLPGAISEVFFRPQYERISVSHIITIVAIQRIQVLSKGRRPIIDEALRMDPLISVLAEKNPYEYKKLLNRLDRPTKKSPPVDEVLEEFVLGQSD